MTDERTILRLTNNYHTGEEMSSTRQHIAALAEARKRLTQMLHQVEGVIRSDDQVEAASFLRRLVTNREIVQ